MKWRVAIPSYARADGLKKWTLATLARGGVDPKLIDIFVANAEQRKIYAAALDKGTYAKIVIAQPGIREARNFISDYYGDGDLVVSADDDIRAVKAAHNGKLHELDDLPSVFDSGFEACSQVKARIWGVYPVCNAFYMKGQPVTTDLRSVIGMLHGSVNDRSLKLQCGGGKEDIERTLLYFEKDGAVVRFNHISVQQQAHGPGGIAATSIRTIEESQKAADYLCKRWPRWVKPKAAFARGHAEVRLSSK